MLKIILVLLLVSSSCLADEWSQKDIEREQAYFVYHVLDWAQTINISKHPDRWHEQTPALGLHPSAFEVDRFFVALGILHFATSSVLPSEYRAPFQNISIVIKKGYVDHNLSFGISAGF